MRYRLVMLAVVSTFAGCANPSGSVSSLTGPSGITAAQVAGQAISVVPATKHVGCFDEPVPFSVTASTNFAGAITATLDNPEGCTISSTSQDAVGTPGSGGTKSAIFTVTPTYGCTVTFTDKKGNAATMRLSVQDRGDGSCWI
jgi:hypothetical protein